jgi:predicted molibdopterin-dependent oxidoreductase YjgC
VIGEDPSATLPLGERALAALAERRFLVVLGAFASRAMERAQVVLPIAAFPETEGTLTSLEGRRLPVRPCLPPPGQARCGWQVLSDLIERLGLARAAPPTFADLEREMAAAVPASAPGALAAGASTPAVGQPTAEDGALVLALDAPFDWGSDPLVRFSPTLRREHVSRRKLFPDGLVELSAQDAERLGLRLGQRVRVVSACGEAVLPAARRADLEPGVALVPFALREHVVAVMGGAFRTEVSVARV